MDVKYERFLLRRENSMAILSADQRERETERERERESVNVGI
jgi:hypothetical protein